MRGHPIRGTVEATTLLQLLNEGEYTCLWRLWNDFREFYFENPAEASNYTTVARFFHLSRYFHVVLGLKPYPVKGTSFPIDAIS